MSDKIKKLADEHWDWLEGLFKTLDTQKYHLDTLSYIYKTAFIHGAKHQRELWQDNYNIPKWVKERLCRLEKIVDGMDENIKNMGNVITQCAEELRNYKLQD